MAVAYDADVSRPSDSGALRNDTHTETVDAFAQWFLGPQIRALFGTRGSHPGPILQGPRVSRPSDSGALRNTRQHTHRDRVSFGVSRPSDSGALRNEVGTYDTGVKSEFLGPQIRAPFGTRVRGELHVDARVSGPSDSGALRNLMSAEDSLAQDIGF